MQTNKWLISIRSRNGAVREYSDVEREYVPPKPKPSKAGSV